MQGLKARVLHQLGGLVLYKAHLVDYMLESCRFSTYSYGPSRCFAINHIEYYSGYHVPLQDYNDSDYYNRTLDVMFAINWRPPLCVTKRMVQPGDLGCSDIWTLHHTWRS